MVVRRRPKPLLYIIIILTICIIALTVGIYLGSPIDKNDDSSVQLTIESGTARKEIGHLLKENDLIRSEWYFSIYTKIFCHKALKASTYEFSRSMSLRQIITSLEKGSTYDPDALILTFKEGKRITDYAQLISDNTEYSYDSVIEKMKDREYIGQLTNKYWFLTEDILNEDIYYPLEGYLAPDTYFFQKDASLEEIIDRLLRKEESNLEPYRDKITTNNIHEIITMASIVELEGISNTDRKMLVGVFNNRLSIKMNLGSDVTTYYALQIPLTKDLNSNQLAVDNPYNTRSTTMMGKMPVGPICNPSMSSIEATINPTDNEYLYFVADKNGKIYYTKSLREHEQKIAEIKRNGDWIW